MASTPKKPKKTAEEKALEIRQRSLLDKEIEEGEERFKALARGKLGRQSLLSGGPRNVKESAGGPRASSPGGASMLGGGGTSTTAAPSSSGGRRAAPRPGRK